MTSRSNHRHSWRHLAEIVAFYQFDNGGRCGSNPSRWEIS